MFKRKKQSDCGCSGHPSGNPKYGHGPCYLGRRPEVTERIRGRRIERAYLAALDPGDEDL